MSFIYMQMHMNYTAHSCIPIFLCNLLINQNYHQVQIVDLPQSIYHLPVLCFPYILLLLGQGQHLKEIMALI